MQENRLTEGSRLRGLVEAALQIASRRLDVLGRLRTALVNHEDGEALRFARELCGLETDEASNRTDSSLH